MNSKPILIVLFLIALLPGYLSAQAPPYLGSVTFFAEEGENFTLYLNGEQQNTKPMPNVKVEEVTDAFISVRIVFEDATIQPVKKSIMRGGVDCVYMIKKNKKGEYVTNVKSCVGAFANTQASASAVSVPKSPQEAAGLPAPIPTSTPSSTPSGPQKATMQDNMIINPYSAKRLWVHKTRTPGNFPQPIVKMTHPDGASVAITYDDNNEKYTSEVPFTYEVKDYNNNNSYFKLSVDEGGGKIWYVRLQHGTSYQLTINDSAFD
jgi:hypothetical protein